MSRRLEIGALLALCFFLPLYEAPKSIFWVLYVVIWVVNRVRARDWGGRWDAWDTLIAAWIASAFAVAPFAGIPGGDEWRGAVDVLRYGSVLWLAKRSRFDQQEIRWILGALVVSALAGTGMGLWAWASIPDMRSLQLNSVGHVNHTAIYLAIMLGLSVSWGLASGRVPAILVTVCLLGALFLTLSRAALLVSLGMLFVLVVAHWRSSRAARAFTLALVVAAGAVAAFGITEVLRKHEEFTEKHDILAQRPTVWRQGLEAWQRYPIAGIGIDNYGRINRGLLKTWRAERGLEFDPSLYGHNYGHGHSLYINTLAERGVIGSLPLAALLFSWAWALWRRRPMPASEPQESLLWGGAASAFIVTAGVGLANTTLHHEHGILASLLLGLWLSKRPGR